MTRPRIIAGCMSGTSADGIDVVLASIDGRGNELAATVLHQHHRPYAADLQKRIADIRSGRNASLADLAQLARDISLSYAAAVNEALLAAHLAAEELTAIAAHGQTLFHRPPLTVQWLDPALLAAETGCQIISDFRRADCAAGGQGAPLVPFADYILFRHPTRSRIILNIGGIANITFLPAGGQLEDTLAFDTGPGNCLSDWLVQRFATDGAGFDRDGLRAQRGQVIPGIVEKFLACPYFLKPHPKSTDGPEMNELFRSCFDRALGDHKLDDLLATAAQATALTIAEGLRRVGAAHHAGPRPEHGQDARATIMAVAPSSVDEIFVSGGGAKNQAILTQLQASVSPLTVRPTSEQGIDIMAREALAFALLGAATLDGTAANIPNVTGATRPVVLGSITAQPEPRTLNPSPY